MKTSCMTLIATGGADVLVRPWQPPFILAAFILGSLIFCMAMACGEPNVTNLSGVTWVTL